MKKKVNTDAMGNRISKTVINKNPTTDNDKYVTTYYMRDPQGNVLAVYEHQRGETGDGTFTLTEQHLYGSSRIGMKKRNLALSGSAVNESTPSVTLYELTNHLSNVVAVISDEDNGSSNDPKVESLTDYYPFGMEMGGRSYKSNDYRFGYTGHEKECDVADGVYTTQYRLLDTRLGRWMSVDPLFGKYPDMSSYNYCEGNPVMMVDVDGAEDAPSSEVKGGPQYYDYRYKNFKERNPGMEPPDYYKNYREKYCKRFQSETYNKLSDNGKVWCGETLLNLQEIMEERLCNSENEDGAELERDPNKFKTFAFQSHVPAYMNEKGKAPLVTLSTVDLFMIVLTPDVVDLVSADGINQACSVFENLVKYWKDNPTVFQQRVKEGLDGKSAIWKEFVDKIKRDPSISPTLLHKFKDMGDEIRNLIKDLKIEENVK